MHTESEASNDRRATKSDNDSAMIANLVFGLVGFSGAVPAPPFNDWLATANFTDSQILSTSTPKPAFGQSDFILYILLLVGLIMIVAGAALVFWCRASKRLKKRELTDIEEVMLPAPGESYDIAHV
jgi:hypothetical protein